MSETQLVHSYFRGAAEVSKRCRGFAFGLEFAAASVVLLGKLIATIAFWLPLISFLLLAASVAFRVFAGRIKEFSDYCRQISMRAFALGQDIPVSISSNVRRDAPICSLRLAAKLPAYSLDEYYDAQAEPGDARLREVYAYSSFYSCELLRKCRFLYGVGALCVLIVALVVLYSLVQGMALPGRELVMDALFFVVLSVVGLRVLEEALAFASASTEVIRIADALIASPVLEGEDLKGLAFQYEAKMSLAPSMPTFVYRIWRRELDDAWIHRRRAIL